MGLDQGRNFFAEIEFPILFQTISKDDLGLEVVFFLNLPVNVGCLPCFTSIYIPNVFNFF